MVFAYHSVQIWSICRYAAKSNKFLDNYFIAIGFGDRFHHTGSSGDINVPHAVNIENSLPNLVENKSQVDDGGRTSFFYQCSQIQTGFFLCQVHLHKMNWQGSVRRIQVYADDLEILQQRQQTQS